MWIRLLKLVFCINKKYLLFFGCLVFGVYVFFCSFIGTDNRDIFIFAVTCILIVLFIICFVVFVSIRKNRIIIPSGTIYYERGVEKVFRSRTVVWRDEEYFDLRSKPNINEEYLKARFEDSIIAQRLGIQLEIKFDFNKENDGCVINLCRFLRKQRLNYYLSGLMIDFINLKEGVLRDDFKNPIKQSKEVTLFVKNYFDPMLIDLGITVESVKLTN